MKDLLQAIMFNDDQDGGEQTPPPENQEQQEETKSYTQSELTKMLATERGREKNKLIKGLGFDNEDALKTIISNYKTNEDANKTDLEKAKTLATDYETKYNNLVVDNKNLGYKMTAIELGVKPDSTSDVLALAERKVTDDIDINASIKNVLEVYPQFKVSKNVNFGKEDQGGDKNDLPEDKFMQAYKNMGGKIKK